MNYSDFIKRYQFDIEKDHLGGGGFGDVYRAFDDVLDRTVALKIAQVKKGFEQLSLLNEVELAKQLPAHRNIARYMDCFRFQTPQGFFDYGVLQYYPTGNLSQLILREDLNQEQKEAIAKGIMEGVDFLHQHHIIHRDLKTANILMAERANHFIPKIADFGLSKAIAQTDNSLIDQSFAGGSISFVSPEQLEGKAVRKNTDLWSLGIILYQLFTKELPFTNTSKSEFSTATERKAIAKKIVSGTLPKAIESIDQPYQAIIKACLTVDSQQRPKSISELYSIIEQQERKQQIQKVEAIETLFVETDTTNIVTVNPPQLSEQTIIAPKNLENPKKTKPKLKSKIRLWWLLALTLIGVFVIFWLRRPVLPTLENTALPEMIYVGEGIFTMGNNEGRANEKPERQIKLSSFSIGKYEITNAQFCVFLNEYSPSLSQSNLWLSLDKEDCHIYRKDGQYFPKRGFDKHPVIHITWMAATAYCQWLSSLTEEKYQLPTEAQWEYAAGGGSLGEQNTYAGSNYIDEVAWHVGNTDKSHEVGQKKPNQLGIFDMSGNVLEMCRDYYDEDIYQAKRSYTSYWNKPRYIENPEATYSDTDRRVIRGGSWFTGSTTDPAMVPNDSPEATTSVTHRRYIEEKGTSGNVGFRIMK